MKNYFPQDDGTTLSACALSVTEASVQAGGNMDTTIVSEILANIPALSGQVLDYDGDGYIDNLTVIMKSEKEIPDIRQFTRRASRILSDR